mgnify:CR=1 FL=1
MACSENDTPIYGGYNGNMPYMYANNDSTLDPVIQDCESGFNLKNQVLKGKGKGIKVSFSLGQSPQIWRGSIWNEKETARQNNKT